MAVSDEYVSGAAGTADNHFAVGTLVVLRADPTRTGPIIAELPAVGGRRRFRVYHSADLIRDYSADQIQPLPTSPDKGWAQRLREKRFADVLDFRAGLTAMRLSHPQVDHIYSLRAARIQYVPFQFKPVLRLLRADQPRLLIADDVGVGKTIEAGLILKELSTRQQLNRVLVLCPKSLTTKWRSEMQRFDENFRVLSAQSLRYCLDESARDGEWPAEYARSIVNYELFRMEPYLSGTNGSTRRPRRGLLELDPPAQFDLIITDEAHHLRNAESASHQLVEHLCQTSGAILMLTATPVQVHSDNLFTLLHLLRPELFPDRNVFREMLEPNRHLTAATRLLRAGSAADGDWAAAALDAVSQAGQTTWGDAVLRRDPRYTEVVRRLSAGSPDDEDRIRCIRDLEELHSLAHVMNRTRRRDIGRFTIREPRTVSVAFTAGQRDLYDAVMAFRQEVLLQEHDPRVVRLIMDTIERQAESCINVLGETVAKVLQAGGVPISELTDDPEAELDGGAAPVPAAVLARARDLLAAAERLPGEDPKADQLLDIVTGTLSDRTGPGKVLIFSFFLNTIEYLRRRLASAGVRVGVVTGQVKDEDREDLRDRFRLGHDDPDAIDVLLSSEVGCEGLDYEFCDRLVNYDIPWNPMRIEQRIGRIDRFGQLSDKVLIFNFITPDTVAERVYFRCFDRLGVFRDTVGDLEEVLGDVVQDLNRVVIDTSLSAGQAAARIRQITDNAIRLAEEQRRLDRERGELLGLDDAFTEEVNAVVQGGRFVAEADLRLLVDAYLGQPDIRGTLAGTAAQHVSQLRIRDHGRQRLVADIQSLEVPGSSAISFVRALQTKDELRATFDQATAAEHRSIEFITPVHPLVRAAVAWCRTDDEPLVGAFGVRTTLAPTGLYVFACELWETIAVRPDLRLVCLAISAADRSAAPDLSRELLSLLPFAHDLEPARAGAIPGSVTELIDELNSASDALRRKHAGELEASNELQVSRKLASLTSFHEGRRRRVSAELEAAREPRIVRMKTSELARLDRDFEQRKAALERARRTEILSVRVAAGLLEVTGGI